MSCNHRFKEELLHQLWANQYFAEEELCTVEGFKVIILDPGEINHSDGPDFLNAKIRIGNIVHFGAIEIHRRSKDWYLHQHNSDPKYEKVILHVVSEEKNVLPIHTLTGAQPPTLNVFQLLPANIHSYLQADFSSELPCSGIIHSLSPSVFELQVEKAHKEYLEQKVGIFFQHYDEHLIPSEAWKNALFISLCDGLGVPSNREQMKELGYKIINTKYQNSGFNEQGADNLVCKLESQIVWNYKSSRIATNPKFRIRKAIQLYHFLDAKSLNDFFSKSIEEIWFEILNACQLSRTRHNHRLFVSFFLPAMYGLGVILYSYKLQSEVLELWNSSRVEVPKSILKKFGVFTSSVNSNVMKRIGLVHQFNAYCKPQQCLKCEVLNKAISS